MKLYAEDVITAFAIALGLLVVAFSLLSYYTQASMNDVKSEVFGNITNTTTNQEIVGYIHDSCGRTSWYVWRVDCEKELLKTFITSTKAGY